MTTNMLNADFLFEEKIISEEEINNYFKNTKRKKLICYIDHSFYDKKMNLLSFNKFMESAKNKKILVEFKNIEISAFSEIIPIQILFKNSENFKFRTSLMNEQILLKLNLSSFDNFSNDIMNLIEIMNIKKEKKKTIDSKDKLLFCEEETKKIKILLTPETENEIKKIIKYLSNDKLNNLIFENYNIKNQYIRTVDQNFNEFNKYLFSSGIVILNLIESFYKDFNKINEIINENVKDDKLKEKLFHAHLFRSIDRSVFDKHFESMILDSGTPVNLKIMNKMFNFLKIKEYESFEKIYGRDEKLFYYSKASNYANRYNYEKLVPDLERKIIIMNSSLILNENDLKNKKRL